MWQYNKFKRKKKTKRTNGDDGKDKSPRKPNYVEQLDRVFSLYIRLRDALPNGMVKCISCGKYFPFKQVDCGHFYSRIHMATRWDEDNCNAECRYCLTPDALILTSDFRWVKLGDIKEGDKLFSFEEEGKGRNHHRKYKVGSVTHIHKDIQDVYEVEMENGDKIKATANHKWLVRTRGTGFRWLETKDLWCKGKRLNGKCKSGPRGSEISTNVCKIINVVEQELSYESGWIAGMLDADGHICQQNIHNQDGTLRYGFRVGIAQCERYPKHCEEIKRLLEQFTGNNKTCRQSMEAPKDPNYRKTCQTWQFLITGTNIEKLQFLMRVRPIKISKVDIEKLGQVKSQYDTKVKNITYLGKQEIVVMETDTHTFIANGYGMHNCNRMSSEHLIGYRANLVRKIGEQRVALLEVKAHQTVKRDDYVLKLLIEEYKKKVEALLEEKQI